MSPKVSGGKCVVAILCLLAALLLGVRAQAWWDFALIIRLAEQQHGALGAGKTRLAEWSDLISQSTRLQELEQLQAVNGFFNRTLLFIDDARTWQQTDYWATPVEALIKGAGDCEDYAIAKYLTLRRLGIPSEKLRITYVKALELNQAHMVLTWYATPSSDPLVLDNLIPDIRPASQRRDLLPVYAFNAEGLWLPGPGGGRRTGDSKKLSRWQDLLNKMRAEGFALNES
ncbi:transglutaminase-like cysteine peptidase [Pseudomonas sp. MAP12]|uniref:Transglutaminase-like cysteine peptidase n=1 Tax=Geopseudomonas aromaticivorans TaxID=2849492 RepID=A0ABS6MRI8_9GAMM|nr:transglutaminase-like cysteine peptidase [Pseudomonas aromaticivorans]MBV2131401.1 transglutaminase-like cysteine peptidase [Pseudomonas aromaticivorans]